MSDTRYGVSTSNFFVPLCNDVDFQTVKRKRNNTEHSEDQQTGSFLESSTDGKLNIIYDELRIMRFNQEQMTRGMMNFEHSIRCVNDKLCEVIEVTNKNSNVLKTLAYKSIDLEARSRRNNLIFWGLLETYNENCFFVIRDFIKRHLDLDADNMYLARAHRLGPRKIGQRDPKRPIIVNFRDYCDTDIIMSRARLLKNLPFSIGYDLPKEIKEARKKLWEEVRHIRQTSPRVKFQILYPAKLLVEGKIVRDEFPDWGKAMQESRLTDFSHIDRNFLFDQDLRTDSEMRTRDQIPATQVNFMNEHSSSARDTLDIPSSGPRDETLGTVTMEHDQSDLHPHEQTKDLPCSPSDSSSSKQANLAAAHVIFRPFERPSRPIQRGFRRSSSVSVPRESRQTTGNPNINKQAEKNSDDMSQNRHKSMPQSQTDENTQDTSGENAQGASGENVQGASGENGNSDDFNTKF